ncbi:SRPBCC family protein [Acinetobacter sp. KS-LM10]|uniref:SRPBCC family protein n=1 Tax=Acinetobacter sp. KS-LM10 TaxID=3120518 RepID=UPI0030CD2161
MIYKLCSILCVGLISLQSITHAAIVAWKENIPSSLAPFQNNPKVLADLTQNSIFIYAHPTTKTFIPTAKNQNPTVSFTSSALVVPVGVENVRNILENYQQYVELFPNLKSAKIIEKTDNITQVKYRVSIPTPIPVLNFNEDLTFQHQLTENSLSSLVIDAPIPYGMGKFEWFSLGRNKTLITLTQWSDLNQSKGFLITKILNAIPEVKLGIPTGTNAFILESLRKRLNDTPTNALAAGQLPQQTLNSAQLEKITQISRASQLPVSFIHSPTSVPYQHGAESMRFSTTYHYYDQTPQQLKKWTQPNNYKALFPRQIKSITTSALQNKSQNADFKVSVGLGVIQIPFNFKMNFNYPTETENNFYANGGDLKYLKGKMQFTPLNQGSLLKMTTATKIDKSAPFLLRAVRSLPYHEMLPVIGGNTVFAQKIKSSKS